MKLRSLIAVGALAACTLTITAHGAAQSSRILEYRESVERYWNDWTVAEVSGWGRSNGEVLALSVTAHGKTAEVKGLILLDCDRGEYQWLLAKEWQLRPTVGPNIEIPSDLSDQLVRFCDLDDFMELR